MFPKGTTMRAGPGAGVRGTPSPHNHLEVVLRFRPDFAVLVVACELPALAAEVVVAQRNHDLVSNGVIARGTTIVAEVINVEYAVERKLERVVQQFLGNAEGHFGGILFGGQVMRIVGDILMQILHHERPVVAGVPVDSSEGIECVLAGVIEITCVTERFTEVFCDFGTEYEFADRHREVATKHGHRFVNAMDDNGILDGVVACDRNGRLVMRMECRNGEIQIREEE